MLEGLSAPQIVALIVGAAVVILRFIWTLLYQQQQTKANERLRQEILEKDSYAIATIIDERHIKRDNHRDSKTSVNYQYIVNGKAYTMNEVFGIRQTFPENPKIFYDPNHPEKCFREGHAMQIKSGVPGCLLTTIGVVVFWIVVLNLLK